MEEDSAAKEFVEVSQEVKRRNERLAALKMEKCGLEQELKRLFSRSAVIGGDIGTMQVQQRHKTVLKEKIRKLSSLVKDAEMELARAKEHLKAVESEMNQEDPMRESAKRSNQ